MILLKLKRRRLDSSDIRINAVVRNLSCEKETGGVQRADIPDNSLRLLWNM